MKIKQKKICGKKGEFGNLWYSNIIFNKEKQWWKCKRDYGEYYYYGTDKKTKFFGGDSYQNILFRYGYFQCYKLNGERRNFKKDKRTELLKFNYKKP